MSVTDLFRFFPPLPSAGSLCVFTTREVHPQSLLFLGNSIPGPESAPRGKDSFPSGKLLHGLLPYRLPRMLLGKVTASISCLFPAQETIRKAGKEIMGCNAINAPITPRYRSLQCCALIMPLQGHMLRASQLHLQLYKGKS